MKKNNKKSLISDYSAERYAQLIEQMLTTAEKSHWEKSWIPDYTGVPCRNIDRPAPYEGVNAGLLDFAVAINGYKTPFFLTGDKARDLGLSIKKVENPTTHKMEKDMAYPVWKWIIRKVLDGKRITDKEYDELDEEEKEKVKSYWALRIYFVYNIDQTSMEEDLPKTYAKFLNLAKPENAPKPKADAKDEALDYVLNTKGAWHCPIHHDGGNSAYFSPATGDIHLPKVTQFKYMAGGGYYGTALHEMTHSTVMLKNMKRDYAARGFFGNEDYALEELVAELTAAFVCHDRGIGKKIDPSHIAYVQGWKRAIKHHDIIATILDDIMRCVSYEVNHLRKVDVLLANEPTALAA